MRPAAFAVVACMVLSGCGSDGDGNGADGPSPSTVPAEPGTLALEVGVGSIEVGVTVEPDPPVARQDVTWLATITNRNTRDPETLTFTSGLQIDVVLQREGEEVYRWSEGRAFTQALVEEELEPGGSLEIRLDDTLDVEPGEYDVLVEPRFRRARELGVVGGGTIEVVEPD